MCGLCLESQRPQKLHGIPDVFDGLTRTASLDSQPIAIAVLFEHPQQFGEIRSATTKLHFNALPTGKIVNSIGCVDVSNMSTSDVDELSRTNSAGDSPCEMSRAGCRSRANEPSGKLAMNSVKTRAGAPACITNRTDRHRWPSSEWHPSTWPTRWHFRR